MLNLGLFFEWFIHKFGLTGWWGADLKKVIELDPGNRQGRESIQRLEPLAAEKAEKMKAEMIGKLSPLLYKIKEH
jgi:hypothetical protein